MARILEPKLLNNRLSHYGPCIYFFESDNIIFNKTMVEYLNKLARECPDLGVFKIDWRKYLLFRPCTPLKEIYKVYLYCNKKIQYEKFMPDQKDINEMFIKAIELHNDRIEQKAQNIGSGRKILKLNPNAIDYNDKLKQKTIFSKWARSKIVKHKIIPKFNSLHFETKICEIPTLSKNAVIMSHINSNCQNITSNSTSNLEKNKKSGIKDSSKQPWFCEIGPVDLPSEIFTNDSDLDSNDQIDTKQDSQNYIPQQESNVLRSQSQQYLNSQTIIILKPEYLPCMNMNSQFPKNIQNFKEVLSSEKIFRYKKIAPKPTNIDLFKGNT